MRNVMKQEKYYPIVEKLFLFDKVDKQLVYHTFHNDECMCIIFEPAEKIYTRNSFQKSLGIVLNGELAARKLCGDGACVVLNTFSAGGVFGVAGLFNDAQDYVSEVAAIKRSKVLFVPQDVLQRLFQLDSHIAVNYISYLSNRIRFLNNRIDNFTGGSALGRLSDYLLNLAEKNGDICSKVILPCSLTQLSEMLDIGRASLYRALNTLEEKGLISRDGRIITLVQIDCLKNGQF